VLTKYYPPDFDPSKIVRARGPKNPGPKLQTVRLMAPFSMCCLSCGEFIYKGRKFNARKETTDEKYYAITIYRFYIRCTRCSAEIVFKTDPKNMDYECERGAKRNFEPWRAAKLAEETDEERIDRLEAEEANRDVMKELETKTLDAKAEMAVADALDEIRTRNARNERVGKGEAEGLMSLSDPVDAELERQEREDDEAARRAFETGTGERVRRLSEDDIVEDGLANVFDRSPSDGASSPSATGVSMQSAAAAAAAPAVPMFQRTVKKKRDLRQALGIKGIKQKTGLV
ncbi:hypothetical protein B0A49_09332, partial [Cryomyces minteri]